MECHPGCVEFTRGYRRRPGSASAVHHLLEKPALPDELPLQRKALEDGGAGGRPQPSSLGPIVQQPLDRGGDGRGIAHVGQDTVATTSTTSRTGCVSAATSAQPVAMASSTDQEITKGTVR